MNSCDIIGMIENVIRDRKAAQRAVLQQCSLHVGQPEMLQFISDHPGCSQKQIADAARVSPASVAASIKRMERAGLISRRADTADTRCNRVYVTTAGERELSFCREKLREIDRCLTADLDNEELSALKNLLELIDCSANKLAKKNK